MKKIIYLLANLLLTINAYAEPIVVGCAVRTYDCYPYPDGTTKCSWGTDLGKIASVDLQKTGNAPNYEIWQGNLSGTAKGKYPYTLLVYQRRESTRKVNYLSIDLSVNGVRVGGQGENIVEARYLLESTNMGIGIHCSTDVSPSP